MLPLSNCTPLSENTQAYCIPPSELPCPEDPLSYDIIRHPITVGRSVKHPEHLTIRDIAYVMDGIKNGNYEGYNLKQAITHLRQMTDRDAQRCAKTSLPWFCGSLMHHKRSNINVEKAQFQIFDLDHVPNPEAIKQLAISKLPFIRYAFTSAVDGVKLIAQFSSPITSEGIYKKIYKHLALQIEWALKHICDLTSDWARACFMSYDPALLINSRCVPLNPVETCKQADSIKEIVPPSLSSLSPSLSKPLDFSTSRLDTAPDLDADYAKAEAIISIMSTIPIEYKDWIKIGQALYAGFGERGKALWDMFLNNPNYHDTQRSLNTHWRSFASVRSITLASLFYVAEQYGVML